MSTKRWYMIVIILGGVIRATVAQDFHVTQWEAAALYLNPAHTGERTCHYRASLLNRSQWRYFLARPYNTFYASYDKPLGERWGVGGYVIHNEAAIGFREIRPVISASYLITSPGQQKHVLVTGLQSGIIYKSLGTNSTFDSQYYNGKIDESINSGENIQKLNKVMPELNYGIYYVFLSDDRRWNPQLGLSVLHIITPNEALLGQKSLLPMRFNAYTSVVCQVSERMEIIPKVLLMNQKKHNEIMPGLMYRYYWKEQNVSVMAESCYRLNDAVIAGVGLKYKEFVYRFSYDFNISGLRSYSKNRGAIEFSIIFQRSVQ